MTKIEECPIEVGKEVYWEDPDNNLSSGVYRVEHIPENLMDDSIITITNDYSTAEVFLCELSYI